MAIPSSGFVLNLEALQDAIEMWDAAYSADWSSKALSGRAAFLSDYTKRLKFERSKSRRAHDSRSGASGRPFGLPAPAQAPVPAGTQAAQASGEASPSGL